MQRLKSLLDPSAALLLLIGCLLFGARIALPTDTFINLPQLETTVQLCGALLILAAFAIVISRLFWPGTPAAELMDEVRGGNVAAGIVLAGLKIFNGLSIIGFALLLASLYGAHP